MTVPARNPLMLADTPRAGRQIIGSQPALEQLQRHCDELNSLEWCRGEWTIGMGPDRKRCIMRVTRHS